MACGAPVEVDRDAQLAPEALAHTAGQRAQLVPADAFKRRERRHVEGADARMRAMVAAQVDTLDRDRRRFEQGIFDGNGRPDEGHHGAMMVGVHGAIEQPHAGNAFDGAAELSDGGGIATL